MSAKHFLRAFFVCILAVYTAACNYNPPKSTPDTYQYPDTPIVPRKTQESPRATKPNVAYPHRVPAAVTPAIAAAPSHRTRAEKVETQENTSVKRPVSASQLAPRQNPAPETNLTVRPPKVETADNTQLEALAKKPDLDNKVQNSNEISPIRKVLTQKDIVKNATAKKLIAKKPQPLSLQDLPLNLAGRWVLDLAGEQCLLSSRGLRMADGQGGTPITLVISESNIAVLTDSNIDLSYAGSGVKIDSKHLAFEKVDNDTNVVFIEQRQQLLNNMVRGSRLELVLGFWPTWPKTQAYRTAVPLTRFSSAFQAWRSCNELINKNHV